MRKPVENFARDIGPADTAGRLDAPSFHNNKDAITAELTGLLGGCKGDVLEIGSGTGQHAVTFAVELPGLTYWPTDPVPDHVASIDAWSAAAGLENVMPATCLDCCERPWRLGERHLQPEGLDAVIAINVIHIATWNVAEAILAGARQYLKPGGLMIFYGPYKKNGEHTSQGNIDFDAALRARNPAYGIRDLERLIASATSAGLHFKSETDLPANNKLIVFAA